MGIVNNVFDVVSANMTGSSLATHIAIGIGSLAYSGNQTALDSESDRNQINAYDLGTTTQITMIANYSPVEISGTVLKEFGTMTTGSVMLNREVLNGSLVFDGEQELQIQQTFKFYG